MTDDPEHAAEPSKSLEPGLAAGFGPAERSAAPPAPSILEQLAENTGVRPGVSLRDEPSDSPARLLRPMGRGAPDLPKQTGKYQLQGEIARGGVGVVLKGHDVDLGRDVAIKVLHEKYLGNPDLLQRFVEEAQIGGQLQHPGIVPVYDLGLNDGRPYFTMKLIKGRTLASLLDGQDEERATRRCLLTIFEQVCQTIAYAHARGVIHRDLKPANIMVGAFGEVQVVDWGMGKVLFAGGTADEERAQRDSHVSVIETLRSKPGSVGSQSIVGSVMGTPAYMPPEQANGEVERMDERSDVFALGAILCEILTGAPPYVGEPDDVLAMAAKARLDPCRQRLQECSLDEDLRELVTDCLMPAVAKRPRNAGAVARRIATHLASVEERVRAAQIEAAEERVRTRAARRSQRLTLGLAASVLLTLVLGGGGAWWVEQQARARSTAADQQVAVALSEANALLGQARASGLSDLTLWERAAAKAEQVAVLAASDDVPRERGLEARAFLATVEGEHARATQEAARRARDERMVEHLIRLRISGDDDVRRESWLLDEAARLDEEYDEAFTEYLGGRSVLDETLDAAVAALGSSGNCVELAAALDHWALARDSAHGVWAGAELTRQTDHLRAVAASIDTEDSWRNSLRFLLPDATSKRAMLEQLASEVDLFLQPAVNVALLGEALWTAGAKERAVEVFRRGREVHPADFGICNRLWILLELLDDPPWEEVVQMQRIAHALRPDMREVLHHMGMALRKTGHQDEAIRVFDELLRDEPESQHLLSHISWCLKDLHRLDERDEIYRRILRIDWNTGWAHTVARNVGAALRTQGRFEEAIDHYQRAHAHYSNASDPEAAEWMAAMIEQIEETEAELARRPALEQILRGERQGDSGEEWTAAADLAYARRDYALSARMCRAAFEHHPELVEIPDSLYNAACSAALAAAGSGREAAQLDAEQRSEWRMQAVAWMEAELDSRISRFAADRKEVIEQLRSWQQDADLAAIREEGALRLMYEDERAVCRSFWSAVQLQIAALRD